MMPEEDMIFESLSARRAWIEIVPFDVIRPAIDVVALRKESVDRNIGH